MIITLVSLFVCGLFFIGVFLIVLLVQEVKQQRRRRSRNSLNQSTSPHRQRLNLFNRDNKNLNNLRKTLGSMLGGDQNTINRILDSLRRSYPNQSEAWYLEKAILDLERDRR